MEKKSSLQILFGSIIVALGVGFFLDSLNVFDFSSYIGDLWPLIIIGIGILSLASNPAILMWPLFIIAGGTLLLLRELDALEFNVWSILWPTALILFGLTFIFEKLTPRPKEAADDRIDSFVAFSGLDRKNRSDDFQGGKMTTLFGGITLDLRDTTLKKAATIDIFAAFGGVDLRVPKDWIVKTEGLPLLGGWEDKTDRPTAKNAPVLTVRGTCMFGGFEIKN